MSEDRGVSQLYNSKISGATSFNSWATQNHDFTPQDLNDEPDFEEVLGRLAAAFATDDVLVCHNAGYDLGKALAPMCKNARFGRCNTAGSSQGMHVQRRLGVDCA